VADAPAAVAADPTGLGWLYKLKLAKAGDLDALMDEAAYKKLIG